MPELDAEQLMQNTNAGLARLVEETEKRAKLELERINLERERATRQQELLRKEEHHNAQLDRLVLIVEELNTLLKVMVKSSLDQMQDRIYRIYGIQESLLVFLIKEYEKLKDEESRRLLANMTEMLSTIKSDNNFNVVGSMQSSRDVNLSSTVSTTETVRQTTTTTTGNSAEDCVGGGSSETVSNTVTTTTTTTES